MLSPENLKFIGEWWPTKIEKNGFGAIESITVMNEFYLCLSFSTEESNHNFINFLKANGNLPVYGVNGIGYRSISLIAGNSFSFNGEKYISKSCIIHQSFTQQVDIILNKVQEKKDEVGFSC